MIMRCPRHAECRTTVFGAARFEVESMRARHSTLPRHAIAMKSKTLSLTLTPLLAIPALVACQSGLSQGPLDGRVYQVTLAGAKEPMPDNLVFDGGRFESTA